MQIIFNYSWAIYTVYLIKKKNLLDLKNLKLNLFLESSNIIKKDQIDLLLNSKTSKMEKEENDTYFHEIEGLDAAP